MTNIISVETIAGQIYYIREMKVMLDKDLARGYTTWKPGH